MTTAVGVTLFAIGFSMLCVGFISIIKPIKIFKIETRGIGASVFFVGLAMFIAGPLIGTLSDPTPGDDKQPASQPIAQPAPQSAASAVAQPIAVPEPIAVTAQTEPEPAAAIAPPEPIASPPIAAPKPAASIVQSEPNTAPQKKSGVTSAIPSEMTIDEYIARCANISAAEFRDKCKGKRITFEGTIRKIIRKDTLEVDVYSSTGDKQGYDLFLINQLPWDDAWKSYQGRRLTFSGALKDNDYNDHDIKDGVVMSISPR